jgi:hypothetical protein
MGPRCPRRGKGVPRRIVAIRKRHALGFVGMTERIREMMMIGRKKIKKLPDDLIKLPCIK